MNKKRFNEAIAGLKAIYNFNPNDKLVNRTWEHVRNWTQERFEAALLDMECLERFPVPRDWWNAKQKTAVPRRYEAPEKPENSPDGIENMRERAAASRQTYHFCAPFGCVRAFRGDKCPDCGAEQKSLLHGEIGL